MASPPPQQAAADPFPPDAAVSVEGGAEGIRRLIPHLASMADREVLRAGKLSNGSFS